MAGESYENGTMYQIFIRRAFKCERGKNGAESAYMKNLIDAEQGKDWVRHLSPDDVQFEKVQEYIDKALDKFLTMKLNDQERATLEMLKDRLTFARRANELVQIVDVGLEATQRFK